MKNIFSLKSKIHSIQKKLKWIISSHHHHHHHHHHHRIMSSAHERKLARRARVEEYENKKQREILDGFDSSLDSISNTTESMHKCIAKSQVGQRICSSLEQIIKDLQEQRISLYRENLALKERRIEQLERKLASLESENN